MSTQADHGWVDSIRAFGERLAASPDAAFAEVARATLTAAVGVVVLHAICRFVRRRGDPRPRVGWISRLAYLILCGSTLALAATGFYAVFNAKYLGGYSLLLHVIAAGGFVIGLAGASLFIAPRCAFTPGAGARSGVAARLALWGWLGAGGLAAATMLLQMVPVLGQEDMGVMLTLHRYAGLVASVCGLLSAYLLTMGRWGRA